MDTKELIAGIRQFKHLGIITKQVLEIIARCDGTPIATQIFLANELNKWPGTILWSVNKLLSQGLIDQYGKKGRGAYYHINEERLAMHIKVMVSLKLD